MGVMRRKDMVRAGLTLAVVPLTAPAAAQTTNAPPIAVSAEVRYDSNVSHTSAAQAAARGLVQADEIFRPSVDLNLAKHLGSLNLTLAGNVGYTFYARNTRLNRERIGLNGGLAANLARCLLNASTAFSRRQSDLADLAVVTPGSGADAVQNIETTFQYGAEAACGAEIGIRPTLGIQRETGTNSNARRSFSDFSRTDYTAGVSYMQPVFGKLSLLGTLEDVDYPNRPKLAGASDGYLSKSIGVRFERRIGANLQGVVQVNYNDLNPRRAGVGGFSGLTYSADLSAMFADRIQVRALFSRDTRPTLQSDAAYRVSDSYGLDATVALSQRLSLGLGGTYRTRRFAGAGVLGGVPLTNDKRKNVHADIGLRASDRLRFSLDALYDVRDSSVAIDDGDNTGVGLRASLSL